MMKLATMSTVSALAGGGTSILIGKVEERPQNPNQGDLYFNTTYDTLEQYTKSGWQKMGYQIAMALKLNKMELM